MNCVPELPLEPNEEKVIGYCAHCGEEVYEKESAYLGEEGYIHSECFIPFIEDRFGVDFMAEKMGYTLADFRCYI